MLKTNVIYIHGYKLVLTCYGCPEQYDVFDPEGDQVCYIRLRHGTVKAHYPDFGGAVIYECKTIGDGVFDQSERLFHMYSIIADLQKHILKEMHSFVSGYD